MNGGDVYSEHSFFTKFSLVAVYRHKTLMDDEHHLFGGQQKNFTLAGARL